MTYDDLYRVKDLEQEIQRYDQRIDELRAQRVAISAPAFDREPSGRNDGPGGDNKIERLTAEIIDLEQLLHINREKRVIEKQRLERYIASVDDSTVRRIMELRFYAVLSWNDVAAKMGSGYTVGSLKMMLSRYLERHTED